MKGIQRGAAAVGTKSWHEGKLAKTFNDAIVAAPAVALHRLALILLAHLCKRRRVNRGVTLFNHYAGNLKLNQCLCHWGSLQNETTVTGAVKAFLIPGCPNTVKSHTGQQYDAVVCKEKSRQNFFTASLLNHCIKGTSTMTDSYSANLLFEQANGCLTFSLFIHKSHKCKLHTDHN